MAKIDKRIEFLAKNYNVFMTEEVADLLETDDNVEASKITVSGGKNDYIDENDETILAIVRSTINEKNWVKKKVYVHEDVFASMIAADPTPNKIYLQWMLTVFTRYIKDNNIEHAIRFANEDLPQASEYLELFEGNKRKRMFRDLCKGNHALKDVEDYTNINQYKNLSQVFDAVDPFIEREPSDLERAMKRFVDAGQAEIPVRDRNFTIYVPLTKEASAVMDGFASWCTAKMGYTNFESYTGNKDVFGNPSKLYIIINNELFSWNTEKMGQIPNEMLYQLHVESGQLMHRGNGSADIYETVIEKSEAVSNYFYDELIVRAKASKSKINSNKYLKRLIEFGHSDALFDIVDSDKTSIKFERERIPKLPDMSRFKNLKILFINNANMKEIHPSLFECRELKMVSLPDNEITSIPAEIGKCKNLTFINLSNNPIKKIPDEIAQLDRTKGGKLYRISVRKGDIGEDNYEKLKRLLPSVKLTSSAD